MIMTMDNDQRRPYGPTAGVVAFCERARSRNLPEEIGDEFIQLAGVQGQSIPRTRHALVFLRLIDEDGTPTSTLRDLAAASEDGWRGHLRSAVGAAYETDLANVDPAKDGQASLRDWFQRYEPRSQTNQITSLFLGLCRESGMEVKDPPRARGSQRKQGTTQRQVARTPKPSHAESPADSLTEHQPRHPPAPGRSSEPSSVTPEVLLFGVTSEVLAELDDDEFPEVWQALGKLVRRRARATAAAKSADGAPLQETGASETTDA